MSDSEKPFRSITEQVEILISHNLLISDKDRVASILQHESYYCVVNGYKAPFLAQSDDSSDKFIQGTTFDELYSLYHFDRDLRCLLFKYILVVENAIKSVLAYQFSQKYGHRDYLVESNFITTSADCVDEVRNLIKRVNNDVAQQTQNKNPMILHYNEEYGFIPPWVLVKILTFGTIRKWYSLLVEKDKNNIGREFGLFPNVMNAYLNVLNIFRNSCAHDERIYTLQANKTPKNIATQGHSDVFALIIILKAFLPKSSYNEFYIQFINLVIVLSQSIRTIELNRILEKMGLNTQMLVSIK